MTARNVRTILAALAMLAAFATLFYAFTVLPALMLAAPSGGN